MSADWTEHRLGDVTKWASGGTPSKKNDDFWNGEIPWISATSMKGTRYSSSDLKITEVGLKAGSRLAEKDTILLLVRGSTLHKKILVGITENSVSFNQDVKAITPTDSRLDSWYLLFWFMSIEKTLLDMVENTGIGAGKLDTKLLQNLIIKIPPKEELSRIKTLAKNLDDKIILNRQTNQTLEHIAQALFKSWFVDFEPTRAKIAAKQAGQDPEWAAMAAISGKTVAELDQLDAVQLAQLKTTAALFPDGLVESELGEVPEGWCTEAISEWGSIICGKTPSKKKKEYYGGQIPFIKIPDMHASMYAVSTTDTLSELGASSQPKKLLPIGSVCVSCIATVGKVVITNQKAFTNQQINSIIPNNDKHTPYLYFTMLGLNDHLHDLASGGSATLNLNTGNFSKIDILRPSNKVLEAFAFLVKPMLSNIMENCLQEANLAYLRNTLLPKLLSGELSPTTTEVA